MQADCNSLMSKILCTGKILSKIGWKIRIAGKKIGKKKKQNRLVPTYKSKVRKQGWSPIHLQIF